MGHRVAIRWRDRCDYHSTVYLGAVARASNETRTNSLLKTAQNSDDGFQAPPQELSALVGHSGQSVSPLRPAGVALIDGKRVDVVTNGEFIQPETEVEVIDVEGRRVVVRSR